jgi:hypothetical protein
MYFEYKLDGAHKICVSLRICVQSLVLIEYTEYGYIRLSFDRVRLESLESVQPYAFARFNTFDRVCLESVQPFTFDRVQVESYPGFQSLRQ